MLSDLLAVWRAGGTAGVGTVVRTFQSAPRLPGAAMVVAPDGTVSGSVSGGCVEGAVYDLATEVTASGVPVLQRYGVSDDDAFEVGLTCGGILDIFVEPVSRATFAELEAVAADIEAHRPVAVATVIAHPDAAWVGRRLVVRRDEASGSLGSARADAAVIDDARGLLAAGRSEVLTYGPDGQRRGEGMEVFVAGYAPRPRMLVFGAIDFAAAVAQQGSFLGYRVTVCDARPVFATAARFPGVEEVVVDWPHRYLAAQVAAGAVDARTVICVLTHDPEVRRAAAGGRAAAAGGRLRRRDGVAAHAQRSAGPAARGGPDRRRAEPAAQPDRARPGRPDAGGDGGVDRRGDHRPAVGRRRAAADRDGGADPRRGGHRRRECCR